MKTCASSREHSHSSNAANGDREEDDTNGVWRSGERRRFSVSAWDIAARAADSAAGSLLGRADDCLHTEPEQRVEGSKASQLASQDLKGSTKRRWRIPLPRRSARTPPGA